MSVLPIGTVTFLFTDIEGSTPLWEREPERMALALQTHNTALRQAIEAYGGVIFKFIGDEFQAVFTSVPHALRAAIAGQKALQSAAWNELGPLHVRMGLHTGEAELDPGGDEYAVSHAKNRAGRIRSAAYGGQILLSLETADLARSNLPEGVSLKDLGEHRLKGMDLPERLFQVCASGLPQAFPALATAISCPNNLPVQMTSFIGREKEIEILRGLLSEHRLVTMTGSGGVGKTRLALQVVAGALSDYPGGVWHVELAPLSDPGLVARTVAYCLSLRDDPHRQVLEILIAFLQSRRILLVLDNCEHLIDACADLAEQILVHCPQVRLLATSREPLGTGGERIYRVPSLTIPELDQLHPGSPGVENESVRLFVDRVQMVLPGFSLTEENAQSIVQICRRLDGIPLALELAATRVGVLTTAQIADRLDDAFRLLVGGSRTALPRQQTLRATIDWSYRLLGKKERLLFRRLAVFAGGWTLEAVESICSGQGIKKTEALEVLISLTNKSMVNAVRLQGMETRYHLLETVRQYAREKLFDAGESLALRQRHMEYFIEQAEIAGKKRLGGERLESTRRIRREHDNLRLAVEWSFDECSQVEAGLRIAIALNRIWFTLGIQGETIQWLRTGLEECAHQPISALIRLRALDAIGLSTLFLGDYTEARRWLEMSIAACREYGELANAELSSSLVALGLTYLSDDPARSSRLLDDAVAAARLLKPEDTWYMAYALFFRSWVRMFGLGEPESAWKDAQEAQALFSQCGARWEGGPLVIYGQYSYLHKDYEQARQYFEQAVARYLEADDYYGANEVRATVLGPLYSLLGEYDQALSNYREMFQFWSFMGSRESSSATNLAYLGSVELRQSQRVSGEGGIEHLRRAALLFGAADQLLDESSFFESIFTQEDYHRERDLILGKLKDPAIAKAWSAGQAMTLEQAIAYLGEVYG